MSNEIVLRTINLGKRYKNRWAAEDVNLEIHRGDVFGFLGPNGAGKSTTIRMIFSLIRPTTGSVELLGYQLETEREKRLRKSPVSWKSPISTCTSLRIAIWRLPDL